MSLHETAMTRWYWDQRGGLLFEEFLVMPRSNGTGRRLLDGLIVLGEEKRLAPRGEKASIADRDVVIIQTKNRRLGMSLMGQTLFSARLLERFRPRSIESVAICANDDAELRLLLEGFSGCKVVICPQSICQLTRR
jgi:hypothetical protein